MVCTYDCRAAVASVRLSLKVVTLSVNSSSSYMIIPVVIDRMCLRFRDENVSPM